MTWAQMLAATHTDAVLVLHQGRIVEERYLNGMKPETPHLMFSATKSMVGLMGAVLVAEGKLDRTRAWPAAARTGRQRLGRRHRAPGAGHDRRRALHRGLHRSQVGHLRLRGRDGLGTGTRQARQPTGILGMLGTLKGATRRAARLCAFRYRSPATDVAGWLSRAAQQSITQWLQERLWNRLGMEHEGNVMLDPLGTEVTFAGMSTSLRDLGRIGQMLLQRGRVGNSRSSRPASSTT